MGCGSGRVLLPCARAGVEMVGLDSSGAMLERLRHRLAAEPEAVRRRVELVEADVRDADLGRRFPLVIAPFRVVQHLLTRDDQRAWLRTVARHLEPGGELVFDVFQPDYALVAEPAHAVVDLERTDPATGRTVYRLATAWHTPELQTFRVRFTWRSDADDEAAEREESRGGGTEASVAATPLAEETGGESTVAETEVRWFTLAELENLLELEGFTVLDAWGGFDRRPFGPGAEDVVLRARRR